MGRLRRLNVMGLDGFRHQLEAMPNQWRSLKNPGTLRRFIEVLDQLSLNYHLYAFHELGPKPLLELLPREFRKWLPSDDE